MKFWHRGGALTLIAFFAGAIFNMIGRKLECTNEVFDWLGAVKILAVIAAISLTSFQAGRESEK